MYEIGDKVKLDPTKCTQLELNRFGSTGIFGEVYEIIRGDEYSADVMFRGSNWHKRTWLKVATLIYLGGE